MSPDAIWPDANAIDLELGLLTRAKLARNHSNVAFNQVFKYTEGTQVVYIKGQPDLSRLRTIMMGVRNPLKGSQASGGTMGWIKQVLFGLMNCA
jgi:cell surface protein SprA